MGIRFYDFVYSLNKWFYFRGAVGYGRGRRRDGCRCVVVRFLFSRVFVGFSSRFFRLVEFSCVLFIRAYLYSGFVFFLAVCRSRGRSRVAGEVFFFVFLGLFEVFFVFV